MTTLTERYSALIQWVETPNATTDEGSSPGGSLHPAVEIYHDELTNGSFRVKEGKSIDHGDAIVNLPLSKTLSYLNAIAGHPEFGLSHESFGKPENTEYFPVEFLRETEPHVIGRFVLMQQYLLGRDSAWWPYIRTLPQPEHVAGMLPVLWPQDDIEFLVGTNAYVAVQEIKKTLKKEYKEGMKLLPEDFALKGYTRLLYLWSYGIFTSRSFRPSLIIPDHQSLGLPCEIDDFSLLLPLYDIGNHSPSADTSWSSDKTIHICKLHSGAAYQSGQQIFNNYGLKTNAQLLLGYGFVLPETDEVHNDYVHIKTKAVDDDDLASTHLVSLRPMGDPSGVVGHAKRVTTAAITEFAHVQDSLITSLYDAIMRSSGGGESSEEVPVNVEDLMAGRFAPEIKEKMINALGSKLALDLENLDEFEMHEPNANQKLALYYREQCRKVLQNALHGLMNESDAQ